MELDAAQKDSRDKETKFLSQMKEMEELRNQLEDLQRTKNQQQREYEDLISSKDDVGKSVSSHSSES